jgi:hypothetical protein
MDLADTVDEFLDKQEARHRQRVNDLNQVCKFCHKEALEWRSVNGKWRLVDCHGTVHSCQQYNKQGI